MLSISSIIFTLRPRGFNPIYFINLTQLIKLILDKYNEYTTISGCGSKCQRKISKETSIPVSIVGDVIDIYENNSLTDDLDLINKNPLIKNVYNKNKNFYDNQFKFAL